jgi:hypothetical protein
MEDYDKIKMEQRVAAVQIGINKTVGIEHLLMQLAMAEAVATNVVDYANELEQLSDHSLVQPDRWAIVGMSQAFFEVSLALKCLCWGYEDSLNH